jgi:hypothetical protein
VAAVKWAVAVPRSALPTGCPSCARKRDNQLCSPSACARPRPTYRGVPQRHPRRKRRRTIRAMSLLAEATTGRAASRRVRRSNTHEAERAAEACVAAYDQGGSRALTRSRGNGRAAINQNVIAQPRASSPQRQVSEISSVEGPSAALHVTEGARVHVLVGFSASLTSDAPVSARPQREATHATRFPRRRKSWRRPR